MGDNQQQLRIVPAGSAMRRLTLLAAFVALLLAGAAMLDAPVAHAAGTVTDCSKYGPGAGTLQEALTGGGAVNFGCSGAIVVPEIVIINDTVLDGSGQNVTLSGGGKNRVLRVESGKSLTVRRLTIANGSAPGGSGFGAGIQVNGGSLILVDSVLTGNNAGFGGGGVNVVGAGELNVANTAFYSNTVGNYGSAIRIAPAPGSLGTFAKHQISGSTFSGNQTIGSGGGTIVLLAQPESNQSGPILEIVNSTISGNTATDTRGSGGLYIPFASRFDRFFLATMKVLHTTVIGNSSGGAAADAAVGNQNNSASKIEFANSIVGNCTFIGSGPASQSYFFSKGYNVSTTGTCGLTGTGDQNNVADVGLAPLASNGGRTQTRALQPGSPALNRVPVVNGSCNDTGVKTDQRGYGRPAPDNANCDSGAYEANAPVPAPAKLTVVKTTVGSGGVFTFTGSSGLTPSPFALIAGETGTFSGTPASRVMDSGPRHVCGLLPDGSVDCWGANNYGETDDQTGPYVQVSSGFFATCALTPDGDVECWGAPPGNLNNVPGPFSQVAVGNNHACALDVDGEVACWGNNDVGQLDAPPDTYVQISSGSDTSCGVTSSGAVKCWGDDKDGLATPPAGTFTQVDVGWYRACALASDGSVACWGDDFIGLAGGLPGPFTEVTVGAGQNCAVTPAGAAECWGANDYSQGLDQPGPFVHLTAGFEHSCGLKPDGSVQCWGIRALTATTPTTTTFGLPQARVFTGLQDATYTINEIVPAGWKLTEILCNGGNPNYGANSATVTLAPADDVVCTFEDTGLGTIVIKKQVAPANTPGEFAFRLTGPGNTDIELILGTDDTFALTEAVPGPYTVIEDLFDGGRLTEVRCDDNNSTGDVATGIASINLEVGETVTCTFVNTADDYLVVRKYTAPPTDSSFNFVYTDTLGSPTSFALSDGDLAFYEVPATGVYTVTELYDFAALGYIDFIGCQIFTIGSDDRTEVIGDVDSGTVSVDLAPGKAAFCTYENEQYGGIKVVKEANPEDGTEFAFTIEYKLTQTPFTLKASANTADNTKEFAQLEAGAYTLRETLPQGWELSNVKCESVYGTSTFSTPKPDGEISIDLAPGDDVTCTYSNAEVGKISITKTGDTADQTQFAFGGLLGDFSLQVGQTQEFSKPAGQYNVQEFVPDGWAFDSIQCTASTGSSFLVKKEKPGDVEINLAAGGNVACTYNNTDQRGSIVIKKTVASGPAGPFGFEDNIPSGSATFDLSGGATQVFTNVVPGSYSVRELTLPTGSFLTEIRCSDSNSTGDESVGLATINVEANETVTCTFTNAAKDTVIIEKRTLPGGGTGFGFTQNLNNAGGFSLNDTQQKVFTNVAPGTYVIAENAKAGFELTDITCTGVTNKQVDLAGRKVTLTLVAGETAHCTFTNLADDTVVIEKQSFPAGGVGFGFTQNLDASGAFTLDDAHSKTFTSVKPGTYVITENDPAGYLLGAINCTGAANKQVDLAGGKVTLTLAAGETAHCTFRNNAVDLDLNLPIVAKQ